jgi:hypothetical protein
VIAPDKTVTLSGLYAKDVILAVRVCNGYVYLVDSTATPTAQKPYRSIQRHQILDAQGTLGPAEMIIDWTTTGAFAGRPIKAIGVSANGTIIVGTDAANPILTVNPATKAVDILYKGIIPSFCKQFGWGAGNKIYMIRGDTALGEEWTIYSIDLGMPSVAH